MDALQLLPEVDRADELKRRSMGLIGAAVPPELFIWRDEPQNDKGVDLSIEAVVSNRATRFLAVVQVKATDNVALNADQSFSLPVATRNLNYLLNGTCPLYILCIAPRRELRYAWARDEAKRLHRDNPDWSEQDTVVIRFSKLLDATAWGEIHERTLAEGRLARQQYDYLTRAGLAECATFGVNPDTLEVLTPEAAYRAIREHGVAIVSAGFPLAIRHYAKFLPPPRLAEPEVALAQGYASYHLGEYFDARGHLARALVRRAELSKSDAFFLDALVNECDLRFGAIDEGGYRTNQLRIEGSAPALLALQVRMDRVKWEHLSERDMERRQEKLDELRAVVGQIASGAESPDTLKLAAELTLLYGEIADTSIASMDATITLHARARMGLPAYTTSKLATWNQAKDRDHRVDERCKELLRRAEATDNPLVLGEALHTRCIYLIGRVGQNKSLLRMIGKGCELPADIVGWIGGQLDRAVALFRRAGSTDNYVRATLTLARWRSSNGDHDGAKDLIDGVAGLAQAMGYRHHVAECEAILSRTTELDLLEQALANRPDIDMEEAAQSDEDVAQYARYCLEVVELPAERFPVVLRACLAHRDEAGVRVNWCRHFRLTVGKEHASINPRSYSRDPDWCACCQLIGHRTGIPLPDAKAATEKFKRMFCSHCDWRSPKRTP